MGLKVRVLGLAAVLAASVASGPAWAGGAYCSPEWRPENRNLGCSSQIAIAPGNDSRVNLLLLLQDRAGLDGAGRSYPDLDWRTFYGRNFLRWQNLRAAWYPPSDDDAGGAIYGGDRCQTVDTGRAAFLDAITANSRVAPALRNALTTARGTVDALCEDGAGEDRVGNFIAAPSLARLGGATGDFRSYLTAAGGFYGGDWAAATRQFGRLRDTATAPWVKETAHYMVARTRLNAVINGAEDRWGWFDLDGTDVALAAQAEAGFRDYVRAYPQGRYAASARGLIRKAAWLQRDYAKLAALYGPMLRGANFNDEGTARLVEEIDDKLLTREGAAPGSDPYLLAAHNLMRMRDHGGYGRYAPLSADELAGQASIFASTPELFAFLQANHAFYVADTPKRVLALVPDDARRDSYTPLAFSRQYLRGLALHATGDRNEEGFWLELIGGAKDMWQRPAVELALARLYEQQGRTDKVFAAGSPITDPRIRRILLGTSAGPDILKAQARDNSLPRTERSFALFTVLLRQLRHGDYAGFGQDYGLLSDYSEREERLYLYDVMDGEEAPVQFFTQGEVSDGYRCPRIDRTAAALAANPRDIDARLCLGDFYRLNGFDSFEFAYRQDREGEAAELGSRNAYPGSVTPRHAFYTSIIADRTATRQQRAYALYRAVKCYAPTNNNTCGGPGVAKPQRAAWFRRLKTDFADTEYARELDYYW